MPPQPPRVAPTTSYLWAIVTLAGLAVVAVIALAIIGLDATSTPLVVSLVGFLTTTAGTLLLLLRLETVSGNVNGNLSELRDQNVELHERLTQQAAERD